MDAAPGDGVSQQTHQVPAATAQPAKEATAKKATKTRKRAVNATAATASAPGAQAADGEGTSMPPMKRKRGPYKKRMKKEGEQKAPKDRKKKAISLLPAVQAFRLQGMQRQATAPDPPAAPVDNGDLGPSKRPR